MLSIECSSLIWLSQLTFTCLLIRSEINKVQGEYAQEREYGFVPSFSRTQRIGPLNDSDSSSLYTLMDDSDGAQSNMYVILPTDLNDENILPAIKQKLETLHPSQRDYVSSQLLSDVSAFLLCYKHVVIHISRMYLEGECLFQEVICHFRRVRES